MSLQRRFSLLGAILLSALCLAILLWNMDFEAVGHAFAEASLVWLLPSSTLVVRGFRWRVLLLEMRDIPLLRLFRYWAIGLLITTTLPFLLGELARSFLVAKKESLQVVGLLAAGKCAPFVCHEGTNRNRKVERSAELHER